MEELYQSLEQLDYYPGGVCGRDLEGDPVAWARYGKRGNCWVGCFLAAIVTTNALFLFKNNALFNNEYRIHRITCSQTKTKNQIPFFHTRTPKHRIQLFQKTNTELRHTDYSSYHKRTPTTSNTTRYFLNLGCFLCPGAIYPAAVMASYHIQDVQVSLIKF